MSSIKQGNNSVFTFISQMKAQMINCGQLQIACRFLSLLIMDVVTHFMTQNLFVQANQLLLVILTDRGGDCNKGQFINHKKGSNRLFNSLSSKDSIEFTKYAINSYIEYTKHMYIFVSLK